MWQCVCQPLSLWEGGVSQHRWEQEERNYMGVDLVDSAFSLTVSLPDFLRLQTYQVWPSPLLTPAQALLLKMSMILMDHRTFLPWTEDTPSKLSSILRPAAEERLQNHLQFQTCFHLLRPPPHPRRHPSLPSLLDRAVRHLYISELWVISVMMSVIMHFESSPLHLWVLCLFLRCLLLLVKEQHLPL